MALKQMPLEREYAKNPDISPEDIKVFRDWLMTQPHLPREHITDLDLLLVYHCCERSLAYSKTVIDLHYTLRTVHNYFKERVMDKNIELCLNTILIAILQEPCVNGYQVIYLRLLETDPKHFSFFTTVKTVFMMYDIWQWHAGSRSGVQVIIDLDKAQLGHVAKLDIMTVKNALYFVQECMIIKLKGVHLINAPYFVDKIMMLVKPFLKKSLMDIINIYAVGDRSFYDIIPKKNFPKEAGGEFLDYKTIRDTNISWFKSNPEFFKEESKKRVDESLRVGDKGSAVDNFGVIGSFKKLDID